LVDAISLDDEAMFDRYVEAVELLMGDGKLEAKDAALRDLAGAVFLAASSRASQGEEGGEPSRGLIEAMKARLGTKLDDEISTRGIARRFEANPYTLLRRFKAVTGMTPHEYRMNCRIERARELLREGWDPAKAALECGVFDQSHLHRVFKAMTAATPGEYRVNFVQ